MCEMIPTRPSLRQSPILGPEFVRDRRMVQVPLRLTKVRQCLSTVATELEPFFDPAQIPDLKLATDEAMVSLESFRTWLEAELPNMDVNTAVGQDSYCYFLKQVALLPFTPEQLLVMSKQEWERSIAFELFERTRNEGLPTPPVFATQAAQIEREAE